MKTTLAAVAALMIAVSPVAAQTPTAPTPLSFVDKQNNTEVLGTDFIGTPVNTKDGQQIGKISNLVFDQEGRIELAVIGVGGFLGIGEKEVAVPFDAVKSESVNGKHVFVVEATKDELKAAPAYKNSQRSGVQPASGRMAHEGVGELGRHQEPCLESL